MAKKTYETELFDSTLFDLDSRYPRKSIAFDPKPFSKQPLTAIYLIFYLPILLFIVPIYAVVRWTYLRIFVPSNGAPTWGLLDFVMVYLVRNVLWYWWSMTKGGIRGLFHSNLTERQRRRRRFWFDAMPDEIQSISYSTLSEPMKSWAIETKVPEIEKNSFNNPAIVPIWWIGERKKNLQQPKAKKGETILVYLTGGGYMISTCHPLIPLAHLMKHTLAAFNQFKGPNSIRLPKSAVTVEYRKSGEAPTPIAFMDCLALYLYLIRELQFDPKDIVILGDSAGGHLVNTLIRYCQDAQLPIPEIAVLICPWTDQAGTMIEHKHSSFQRNQPFDVLSDRFYHLCRDTFSMHFKNPNETLLDVYFSPCAIVGKVKKGNKLVKNEKEIFSNWPKTFLIGTYGDILLDQSTEMYRRLKLSKEEEQKGNGGGGGGVENELVLHLMQGSHDPFVAPTFVFSKERQNALKKLSEWVAKTL